MKYKSRLLIAGLVISLSLSSKFHPFLSQVKLSIIQVEYIEKEILVDISLENLRSKSIYILSPEDIIFLKQFSFVYSPNIWENQKLEYIIWQTRPFPIGERIYYEIKSGKTVFFTLKLNSYYPETPFKKPGGNLYCYLSLYRGYLKSSFDGTTSNKVTLKNSPQ